MQVVFKSHNKPFWLNPNLETQEIQQNFDKAVTL